jgi:transposase-like protein
LQLRIPKLRQGSHFPPFLEPWKASKKALVAVIQEAWVSGVSTRRVDDLMQVTSALAPTRLGTVNWPGYRATPC